MKSWSWILCVCIMLSIPGMAGADQLIAPEVLRKAMEATVLIKAERVYQGSPARSFGTYLGGSAVDQTGRANPELTVNSGIVTSLRHEGGKAVKAHLLATRRFKLDRLDLKALPSLGSKRKIEETMEDRKIFANEETIKDYTKHSKKKNRRLSDVAGSVKLEKSSNGTVIVDNNALARLNSPLTRAYPDAPYDQIDDPVLEAVVREYQRKFLNLKRQFGPMWDRAVADMRNSDLVFCDDLGKWYFEHAAPCPDPFHP